MIYVRALRKCWHGLLSSPDWFIDYTDTMVINIET